MQMEHLEEHLKEEQQQHDLTKLKLNKAEASLRDALARAAVSADAAHTSAGAREARLQERVSSLEEELADAKRRAAQEQGSDMAALRKELERAQREAREAEDARKGMSGECGELRKQLTEANQRVLVRC